MSKPTQKDAELLIQLTTFIHSPGKIDSFYYVLGLEEQSYEDFIKENPVGSDGWKHLFSFGSFLELVGVLVKYGMINEDIVFDYFGTLWEKIGPIVKEGRKAMGAPRWFENYEYLAKKKAEWSKEHPPLFEE